MKLKDAVHNPDHYNAHSIEVIDMMERIWGIEKLIAFCEINAFKYRMRCGLKGDDVLEDIAKAQWYEQKAQKLQIKWRTGRE